MKAKTVTRSVSKVKTFITLFHLTKNAMASFYGWGSTASRLQNYYEYVV